jgi:hypothetical protein
MPAPPFAYRPLGPADDDAAFAVYREALND